VTAERNRDDRVVERFGGERSTYDSSELSPDDRDEMFEQYFSVFPWASLPAAAVGADIGCGTVGGLHSWQPRVGGLHCVDPSHDGLDVARRNLTQWSDGSFHCAHVDELPSPPSSLDFAYSLGVLHHVPDTATAAALRPILKSGAPFLVYLYYAFDNQPSW
jgi:ubiquinone/menaquinone biosynthesis C-methylase UbiE